MGEYHIAGVCDLGMARYISAYLAGVVHTMINNQ